MNSNSFEKQNRVSRYHVLLLLIVGFVLGEGRCVAHTEKPAPLFTYLTVPGRLLAIHDEYPVARSTRVRLNPTAFLGNEAGLDTGGARWSVDLFGEHEVVVRIDRSERSGPRRFSASGAVEKHPGSLAVFAVVDQAVTGVLTIPALGRYQIEFKGVGNHRLNEMLPEAGLHQPSDSGVIGMSPRTSSNPFPLADSTRALARPRAATRRNESVSPTIDVGFMFSRAAFDGAGGEMGMRSLADFAVAEANAIFENSGLRTRLRLVRTQVMPYEETGNIVTDQGNLSQGLAGLDVSLMRDQFGADLVSLVIEKNQRGFSRISGQLNNKDGNSDVFYSVFRRRLISAGFYTYTGGIGRNLGCLPDRQFTTIGDGLSISGVFPYAFAFRFVVDDVSYVTVIGNSAGIRLPFISDPDRLYLGEPMGVPIGELEEADNVSAIEQMSGIVAAYRNPDNWIHFETRETAIRESDGLVSVVVRRSGDIRAAGSARLNFRNLNGLEAEASASRHVFVHFEPGSDRQTVEISVIDDEEEEAFERLLLSLTDVSAGTALAEPAELTVTVEDDDWLLSFDQSNYSFFETDSQVSIPVRYLGALASGQSVSIPIEVVSGTALPNEDYQVNTAQVTFVGPQHEQRIPISILDDVIPEADRSFRIHSGPVSVEIHILDNERQGSLDPEFTVTADKPDGDAWTLAIDARRRLLVGGDFRFLGGHDRVAVGRLMANGSVDESFSPGVLQAQASASLVPQRPRVLFVETHGSGDVLIGGVFASLDGVSQPNLIRLRENGSMDMVFSTSFDGVVDQAETLADGRIFAVGRFDSVENVERPLMVRLLSDGSIDPSFSPNPGPERPVLTVARVSAFAQQPDGRTIIGGEFDTVDAIGRVNIARLTPEGTIDESFDPGPDGVDRLVRSIRVLPGGQIFISGDFTEVSGEAVQNIARLNPDGTLDSSFNLGGSLDSNVLDLEPLSDGRIVVAGEFTRYQDQSRRGIAVLNADGSLDESFDPGLGANDVVLDAVVDEPDWIYVAGLFTEVNGVPSPKLARFKLDLRMPKLVGIELNQNQVEVIIDGVPGTRVDLEVSADLMRWELISEHAIESAPFVIGLEFEAERPAQYFRVRRSLN